MLRNVKREKRGREVWKKWREILRYTLFIFCVHFHLFCGKCKPVIRLLVSSWTIVQWKCNVAFLHSRLITIECFGPVYIIRQCKLAENSVFVLILWNYKFSYYQFYHHLALGRPYVAFPVQISGNIIKNFSNLSIFPIYVIVNFNLNR